MQERASAVRGVEVKDDTIPGGGRATVGVACATGLPDAGTDAAAPSGIPFQSFCGVSWRTHNSSCRQLAGSEGRSRNRDVNYPLVTRNRRDPARDCRA
jgi:hypothetical protein